MFPPVHVLSCVMTYQSHSGPDFLVGDFFVPVFVLFTVFFRFLFNFFVNYRHGATHIFSSLFFFFTFVSFVAFRFLFSFLVFISFLFVLFHLFFFC